MTCAASLTASSDVAAFCVVKPGEDIPSILRSLRSIRRISATHSSPEIFVEMLLMLRWPPVLLARPPVGHGKRKPHLSGATLPINTNPALRCQFHLESGQLPDAKLDFRRERCAISALTADIASAKGQPALVKRPRPRRMWGMTARNSKADFPVNN
jgi:hypothetical protein